MSDVTRILSAIDQGDPAAAEQLLPLVYEELRRRRPRSCPTKSRAKRCRPPSWFTRRICGSSAARVGRGTVGVISLPRQPRPCGESC